MAAPIVEIAWERTASVDARKMALRQHQEEPDKHEEVHLQVYADGVRRRRRL
jgi:hypothetical protein